MKPELTPDETVVLRTLLSASKPLGTDELIKASGLEEGSIRACRSLINKGFIHELKVTRKNRPQGIWVSFPTLAGEIWMRELDQQAKKNK